MTELSDEVHDPKALIPGTPDSVRKTAWSMTIYRDLLYEAGEGLQRIDTASGWSGEAAENFRSMFDGEPKKWLQAGDCFQTASEELDSYSYTLTWAQNQAGEAIRLWQEAQAATEQAAAKHDQASQQAPPDAPPAPFNDPGETKRQAARETLSRARSQLESAGEAAADAVAKARDQAPEEPGWWEQAGTAVMNAGAGAINALASVGNAVVQNPEAVLAVAGGAALTAVAATGEVAGVALDVTGAGAVAGAPLGAVSTAGIVTGAGMVAAGVGNIAYQAAGDDAVEPVDTDDSDDVPSESTEATAWDHVVGETPNPADIHTPDLKQVHILDGEGDGNGGHVAGTGNAGKTEFPEAWDDDKIINSVEDVAKNPDSPPTLERSGNYKFNGTRDGVEIEGYVSPAGQVQTGYPVRGEGVVQNDKFGNPHPAP